MNDFGALVNIEEFGEKRNNFNHERGGVSFYCKNCEHIVEVERPNPKGYIFVCKECGGNNISIGTEEGLKDNYHIK